MIAKSKGSTMLSGPLSTSIFQNKIVLRDLRTVLQFASGNCYKLRRPTIITKCCSPCYKMRSFHLLQNAATLITKFASYYKMLQPLLQNSQIITKCVVTKCRNPYYKMRKLLQNAAEQFANSILRAFRSPIK